MGLTAADYRAQAQALTPDGKAWATNEPDSQLNQLLLGIADEFARVDARATQLLIEIDPRTTTELLEDWERVLGLPDTCSVAATTIAERRNAIVTKLNALGNQTAAYFIELAALYGFEITITEFDEYTVESPVDDPLYGEDWVYHFQVNAPLNSIVDFDTLSDVTDPLRSWGNERMECLIRRYKPAHMGVIFAYS